MRISYAVAKVVAFILIILSQTPGLNNNIADYLFIIGYIAAMFAIIFCVVRGLPVVFEAKKLFSKKD